MVADNRTVRNRESTSVRDPAAVIETGVRRDRTILDSQHALLIKDTGSRQGRTALGQVPTANGQTVDCDAMVGRDVEDAEKELGNGKSSDRQ